MSKTRMSGSGTVSALISTFVASFASMMPLSLTRAQESTDRMTEFVLPAVSMSMDMASMPHDAAGSGGGGGVVHRWLAWLDMPVLKAAAIAMMRAVATVNTVSCRIGPYPFRFWSKSV